MDREPEELQYFGAVGILAVSFKILRSNYKILGLITLTLILPLCFIFLANTLVTGPLLQRVATQEFFYREWGKVLLIVLSCMAFVLAFSLLSTSAVVYTVACLFTGRELSYATMISVVPRVWRRLMITFLWFFAIMFVYYVAFVLVSFLWLLIWIFIIGIDRLNSGAVLFGVGVIAIALFCVHVYISMVWQLANVVSVVEDKYGLGAIKKSRDLMKGKRCAALALSIVYFVIVGAISRLLETTVVHGGSHEIGAWERFADGAMLLGLQCWVNVMWLLSQSVLYFVCKSYHNESIDKSVLSDHLEGYLGEYMPLKQGISAIQLEHLDP